MYKVTKKYARGPESPVGTYKTINEAKKVIQEKLADDASHKVEAIYKLYEGFDFMEEFDQSRLVISQSSDDDSGSSGRGSSQSFNPSPFSTKPQPKGMPQSWVRDEDKKDDKK